MDTCCIARRSARFAILVMLAGMAGCTSTSGLLLRPGPHKQLDSAEAFAHKLPHKLATPRELQKQYLAEYRVEPSDVLSVEPVDFNSPIRLPNEQTILADGSIDLGRYGSLEAAGRTVEEIQAEVQRRVDREHQGDTEISELERQISVRLTNPETKKYYVLGEVNSPGAFTLGGNETVLDAIVQAGGLGDRANRHRVIVARPTTPGSCRIVLPVCYNQVVQLGDTTTNYQIQPGDRIFVPSLTLSREIKQNLFPWLAEQCPRCSKRQMPCPDDASCPTCADSIDAQMLDSMGTTFRPVGETPILAAPLPAVDERS